MATLTPQEFNNLSAAALDWFEKGPAFSQTIQDKPLLNALWPKKKPFSGGKGKIEKTVKGAYTTTIEGFEYTNPVSYKNPANMLRAGYLWKLLHAGTSFSYHEMMHDGISISEKGSTSQISGADLTRITSLFEDKMEDKAEGWARDMNRMLWADGSADPLEIPGILSLILDTPAVGTTGGLNRATLPWWQNRARLTVATTMATADQQNLVRAARQEIRQLRRFAGGKPTIILCGSDFIDAAENELTAKSNYTLEGLGNKTTELTAGKTTLGGLPLEYDPTLDDMGKSKYAYLLDLKNIRLYMLEGEEKKEHTPERPPEVYAHYSATTTVGGMCAWMLRSSGVMSIA